jgi:hypothetical protein
MMHLNHCSMSCQCILSVKISPSSSQPFLPLWHRYYCMYIVYTVYICSVQGIPLSLKPPGNICINSLYELPLRLATCTQSCGNLSQCKTDNLHSIAKAGDIYTPCHAACPSVHQHKSYPTSAHSGSFSAHWLACCLVARV